MNPADPRITSDDSRLPNVVIFRRELLRYSETFIANQARALRRYSPLLVGTRRGDLPLSRVSVAATTVLPARLAKVAEFGLFRGATPPRFHRLLRHADLVHAHFGPDAALLVPALSRAPLRRDSLDRDVSRFRRHRHR